MQRKNQKKTLNEKFDLLSGYQQGRRYFYMYESQILTGAPETASQYSGFSLVARVQLVVSDRVLLRLDGARLKQANQILSLDRPAVLLPLSFFREIPEPETRKAIENALVLPISFKWSGSGRVTEVQVTEEDPFWSVNAKKAILSMLNVNMKFRAEDVTKSNGVLRKTKYFEVSYLVKLSFFLLLITLKNIKRMFSKMSRFVIKIIWKHLS